MELASQIKKYRQEFSLSQEELAERIYVSRQSVSNWENEKTYPDLKSLLMLSQVFSVSLDDLVKGDLNMMKQEISAQERAKFQRDSNIFAALLVPMILTPVPLAIYLNWWGLGIYLVLIIPTFIYANRLEGYKKKYDIQTYKEILAFTEGKTLDEIEKAQEVGKRPYQTIFYVIGAVVLTLLVCGLMLWLLT